MVEGVRGEVRMQMELIIRFDYGTIVPWVRNIDGVLRAIGGPDALSLWTPVHTYGVGLTTRAEFTVCEGDRVPFLLAWHPSHETLTPIDVHVAVEDTCAWWESWCSRSTYDGEWPEEVMRSLITLKALTFEPTGGIVAAPTTSLPEQIGGVRNWDYRFCWLRDATFTLYALLVGGYTDEAVAWRNWLLRAVAGDPADLQIMYGPAGERRLTELELPWLPGYENSCPVRTGNAAVNQLQLDIYGEVMDAMHLALQSGADPDPAAWQLEMSLINFLERLWHEPDEGIWEVRGPRRHFTHSKVMAWVAFDRAVTTATEYGSARADRQVDPHREGDPRRGLREGLRRETGDLHAVLRGVARGRQPPDAAPGRFPAAERPTHPRHRRGDRAGPDGGRLPPAVCGRPPPRESGRPARWRGHFPALHVLAR